MSEEPKRTKEFAKLPSIRIILVILIAIVIAIVLFIHNVLATRKECRKQIIFHPKTESVETDSVWSTKQGKDEYYSFWSREFKTMDEAISYCIDSR